MRFIGDIHGTFNCREYREITNACQTSIQVGDLGLGFQHGDDKVMFRGVDTSKHYFIRGNHDNPRVCERQVNHIESGNVDGLGMFFVNGGWSIDGPGAPWCPSAKDPSRKPYRTVGKNWWADEEHEQGVLDLLYIEYMDCKPEVVVTHEGPTTATNYFFNPYPRFHSRTALILDKMWQNHKPEYWIFGHWHKRKETDILGTKFICLEECGFIDI